MIQAAPFRFMDLTEGQHQEACADVRDKTNSQNSRPSHRCSASAAFTPLGPDPQAASELEFRYTEDDLAKAIDEARRRATEDAEAELRIAMADDLERRRADLLSAISDQLEQHRSAFDEELIGLADVSRRLVLALSETLIPRALERQPLADIEDVLRSTLTRLTKEPTIELRLPPDLIEVGKTLLDGIVNDAGFPGEITTTADPEFSHGDVELRWIGGAVERRTDRLQAEARNLVERWFQDGPVASDQLDVASPPTPAKSSIPIMPSDQDHDTESEHE